MKFLVVLALAAVALAEPEADPAYVYTNGVYAYNPAAHAVVPTVYNRPLIYSGVPVVVKAEEKQDPAPEAPAPAPEATAEETAVVPQQKVVVPAAYTIPYATAPIVAAPYAATPYVVNAPKYYAQSAGVVHVVNKREAEADATADPAYYYNAYGYGYPSFYARPYAYGYGLRPYGYYY